VREALGGVGPTGTKESDFQNRKGKATTGTTEVGWGSVISIV